MKCSAVTKSKIFAAGSLAVLLLGFTLAQLSCGGYSSSGVMGQGTGSPQDLCNCVESEPASADFRTDAKHVDLPQIAVTDITVGTVLKWSIPLQPAFDAPRVGIELQMFHIGNGFLQFAWLRQGDCDLHLEISDSPDKNAPRIIVETPHMNNFCSARRQLAQQLASIGFSLSANSGELATAVPVDVVGLAFQDFNHPRGTVHVASVWELHPAIVTLK